MIGFFITSIDAPKLLDNLNKVNSLKEKDLILYPFPLSLKLIYGV